MNAIWCVLLVAGFGIQHSLLATTRVKGAAWHFFGIEPITWRGIQSLVNALYILGAAVAWPGLDGVVWEVHGLTAGLVSLIGLAGWISYFYFHLFEYDCGLAFGSSAVASRVFDRETPRPQLWDVGFRKRVRFPVHTAFFPMFFALPHMSYGAFVFAVTANAYNIVGTVLYDRRMVRLVGEPYEVYQRQSGLLLPPLRPSRWFSNPLSKPTHWRDPLANVPGFALGLLVGMVWWRVLGATSRTAHDLFGAWAVAVIVAAVAGVVLAMAKGGSWTHLAGEGFDHRQTVLATNAALVSAIGLVTWCAVTWLTTHQLPHPVVILPMWVTTLWLAHVSAAFTIRRRIRSLRSAETGLGNGHMLLATSRPVSREVANR